LSRACHQVRRARQLELIVRPISFATAGRQKRQQVTPIAANPVVHLELRTDNLPRACAFYTRLFGWHAETIHVGSGSYLALDVGDRIGAGVVEQVTARPSWLPYVEVADITDASERGRRLGASVVLAPREGAGGWRSILAAPAGAEIALWQPKA
jgi:uncharacterized protein